MKICKNFDGNMNIETMDDWKIICPPEGKDKQWKDGRSAKELAREWTNSKDQYIENLLDSYDAFKGIKFKIASPEYQSKFDNFGGKGRQHDLLILAEDNNGEVIISIEGKVDESFGNIIQDYYIRMISNRINGSSTKIPDRIENLITNVFDRKIDREAFQLRYQLLHSIAGLVAEAKNRNINRAIFIIQTFYSEDMKNINYNLHRINNQDLDRFIKYISCNNIKNIDNNNLIGPFNTKDTEYLSSNIDFYILKTNTKIK